jgi:formamidopyrimidine-DNA glycosylase
MPELPEVESLRRSLEPFILNQTIKQITITKPKLVYSNGTKRIEDDAKTHEFINGLEGQKIKSLDRVNKNIVLETFSGKVVLIHLKMTGQLVYQNETEIIYGGHPIRLEEKLPNKHSHIIFELENGTLFYNDTRQFGYLLYYPSMIALEFDKHFDKLGLDPFDNNFTSNYLANKMKVTSGTVKQMFLKNSVVCGLGNIYSDEVCFYAGVRPTRTCKSLKDNEIFRIYDGIKEILTKAIDEGGSSIANYLLGDGSRGNYANYHKVYNRAGKECLTCGKILKKIVHASRTTVYCIKCQK